MKYLFILFGFLFNFEISASEYHPRVNIEKINDNQGAIYYNSDNLDELNSFKQIYYKDLDLGSDFPFKKGIVEYFFLKSDGVVSYGFSEHFFDCLSNKKIIYKQIYDSNGDYISSETLLVDLNKYGKDYEKPICRELFVIKK